MVRIRSLLAAGALAASLSVSGAGAVSIHVATASGPLAVLNGIAALDLQAVIHPLGIPAPYGQATLVLQSTFEPPSPHAVTIRLDCAHVTGSTPGGHTLYASGAGTDDRTWYVTLAEGLPLGSFSWSTTAGGAPCGAPLFGGVPVIGPVAIAP